MTEFQIYNDIGSKKEQAFLSAWGLEDMIFSADTVKKILADYPDEKEMKFNIHCDGGSVSEGLAIYDILRNSGRSLYMNVEGGCHSMAVILLLAAPLENRTGNPNLRALVHRVYAPLYGYYTADELKAIEDSVEREENAILDIYEDRTGKSRAALKAWMKSEKERTAKELLDMNFISNINSYNTNSKVMKQNVNSKSNLLKKASGFLNRAAALLNPKTVNYDYKDSDGNTVFTTETEEDTLAVGDTVTVTGEDSGGTFTLDDGRIVTIEDNTVTEIAEAGSDENEAEIAELRAENANLRNALTEANQLITELSNSIESSYEPAKRVVTKQNPANAKPTVEELKNAAAEKRKQFKS